jgi:hypothetical protein
MHNVNVFSGLDFVLAFLAAVSVTWCKSMQWHDHALHEDDLGLNGAYWEAECNSYVATRTT